MSEAIATQRKKLVVLCSSIAIFAGTGGTITDKHPKLAPFWIGIVVLIAVYAVVEFAKLKRMENQ